MALLAAVLVALPLDQARADDYRLEVGVVDAVSLGVVIGATQLAPPSRGPTMIGGALLGLIGAPLVLFQVERPERAAISLGAHAVLPLGSLFAVGLATPNQRYYGWALLAGFAAATALDLALAKFDDPPAGKRVVSIGVRF